MIELERDGAVAVLTMARPPVNAFDDAQVERLHAALAQVRASDARVLLVRSSSRHFSAGADIAAMDAMFTSGDAVEQVPAFSARMQDAFAAVADLEIVTVASVNGVAAGGGLEIALCCDLVVAGTTARFGLPEVLIGLIPSAGGTQRLTDAVGPGRAIELLLNGDLLSAQDALACGLVHHIADENDSFARKLAARLAMPSLVQIRSIKACVALCRRDSAAGLARETEATRELCAEPETIVRIRAFLQSRKAGA